MSAYLIYVGKGKGSLPGVPARDLSYNEARKHNVARLVGSGLYRLADEDIISDLLKDETPAPKKRRSKLKE